MTEELFTRNEIIVIERTVMTSPGFRDPNAIGIGENKLSILKVSPKNGLIFTQGNEDTGFTHIQNRHNFWTDKFYWKNSPKGFHLENPSKFNRKSISLFDYSDIADDLFKSENLNSFKNKRDDVFDLYLGFVTNKVNGDMNYRMLLYRGTKIIHTLFPEERTNNKKKHIDLVRGEAEGKFFLNNGILTLSVPYLNHENRVIYSLQIVKNYSIKEAQYLLINHKTEMCYQLLTETIEKIEKLQIELETLQRTDLDKIEQIIKSIESKTKGD